MRLRSSFSWRPDGSLICPERVMARVFAIETPLPLAKPLLVQAAAALTPKLRAGDYAQAVMDLGATICTPRAALCMLCPLEPNCLGTKANPLAFPVKAAKPERPDRYGHAYILRDPAGDVYLQSRPPKGLLGGMTETPGSPWESTKSSPEFPRPVPWKSCGQVVHIFTHFRLELEVWTAEVDPAALAISPGNEAHLHAFATEAVSTAGERATLYLHTSPEFAMKTARTKPVERPPESRPKTPGTPKMRPVRMAPPPSLPGLLHLGLRRCCGGWPGAGYRPAAAVMLSWSAGRAEFSASAQRTSSVTTPAPSASTAQISMRERSRSLFTASTSRAFCSASSVTI